MKKTIAILVVTLFGCGIGGDRGIAQTPTAVPLLDHFAQASQMLPDNSYELLVMRLDVNGDALDDLLISKVDPKLPTREQGWFLYLKMSGRTYRSADGLEFSFLLFRLDENGSFVTWAYEVPATIRYRIDAAGFHEIARMSAPAPESDAFAEWRTTTSLKVLSADFDAVKANASPRWIDLVTHRPATNPINLSTLIAVP